MYIQLFGEISMGSDVVSVHSAVRRKKRRRETTQIAQDTAFGSLYGLLLLSFVDILLMMARLAMDGARFIPSRLDQK